MSRIAPAYPLFIASGLIIVSVRLLIIFYHFLRRKDKDLQMCPDSYRDTGVRMRKSLYGLSPDTHIAHWLIRTLAAFPLLLPA